MHVHEDLVEWALFDLATCSAVFLRPHDPQRLMCAPRHVFILAICSKESPREPVLALLVASELRHRERATRLHEGVDPAQQGCLAQSDRVHVNLTRPETRQRLPSCSSHSASPRRALLVLGQRTCSRSGNCRDIWHFFECPTEDPVHSGSVHLRSTAAFIGY